MFDTPLRRFADRSNDNKSETCIPLWCGDMILVSGHQSVGIFVAYPRGSCV